MFFKRNKIRIRLNFLKKNKMEKSKNSEIKQPSFKKIVGIAANNKLDIILPGGDGPT